MKKKKNVKKKTTIKSLLAIGLVIVFLLLLLATNYWISTVHNSQEVLPTPTQTFTSPTLLSPTPTPRPIPPLGQIPPTTQETLNTWKKYTNTKYSYTVMYPPTFIIFSSTKDPLDITDSLVIDSPTNKGATANDLGIAVFSKDITTDYANGNLNPNSPKIRSVFSKQTNTTVRLQNYIVTKTDDLQVNGHPAYGLIFQIGWFFPRTIIIDHGNYVYEISSTMWNQENIFKQLLSTFAFTN